jgi:hypothetical protein
MINKAILIFVLLFAIPVGSINAVQSREGGTVSDGIPQDLIDSTVRITRRSGGGASVGSGTIISKNKSYYTILTNYHVAKGKGTENQVEIWNDGNLVGKLLGTVRYSWFQDGVSKDIALLTVNVNDIPGPMPRISLAPYGTSPKVGDKIIAIGCSDARWPRGRTGNILKIQNGLMYYEPESIGGDSGSAVFSADGKYIIGLTAWAIKMQMDVKNRSTGEIRQVSRWVGLAMTSDRVHDIIQGRASAYDIGLPEGAIPIEEYTRLYKGKLPVGAKRIPHGKTASDIINRTQVSIPYQETIENSYNGATRDWRNPYRNPPEDNSPNSPNSPDEDLPYPDFEGDPDEDSPYEEAPDDTPNNPEPSSIVRELRDLTKASKGMEKSLGDIAAFVNKSKENGFWDWWKKQPELPQLPQYPDDPNNPDLANGFNTLYKGQSDLLQGQKEIKESIEKALDPDSEYTFPIIGKFFWRFMGMPVVQIVLGGLFILVLFQTILPALAGTNWLHNILSSIFLQVRGIFTAIVEALHPKDEVAIVRPIEEAPIKVKEVSKLLQEILAQQNIIIDNQHLDDREPELPPEQDKG